MAEQYDVFISHASEDKDSFVRPLAVALRSLGISVWYDEFSLKPGDSLSRSIDKGIASSRHGLIVLSLQFLRKPWTEFELRGLVNREIDQDARIIPIWHGVSRSIVVGFSPTLADKVAIITGDSEAIDIALQVLRVVRPDIYTKHPRSELVRIASGEAIAELQAELGDLKEQLAEFQCSYCGAPLVEQRSVAVSEHDDDLYQVFECGRVIGPRSEFCPSDPRFPKLEEYDLRVEQVDEHSDVKWWRCYAIPRTEMARHLFLRGMGRTEQEAKERLLADYQRAAKPWRRDHR